MFLIDSAKGGADFPEAIRHISELLQRHGAEIERIEKWAERKMAYRIRGVDRGIYILIYFRNDPSQIEETRRDINLSEEILRVLFLKCEEVPPASGELYTPEGETKVQPTEETEDAPEAVSEGASE
jgi:ribosomal protein S6